MKIKMKDKQKASVVNYFYYYKNNSYINYFYFLPYTNNK